jgi:penicillin amidase
LENSGKINLNDMNQINIDAGYNHIPGMNLLSYVVDAANSQSNGMISQEVIDYLEDWNHHYNDYEEPRWPNPAATYDDPGLTIFEAWYNRIFDEVFEDDLPSYADVGPIHREYARVWPSTLIHVFDGEESTLPLNFDYLNGEDRDDVILRVLEWAIGNLTDQKGADMTSWLTPVGTVTFDQQGAVPTVTMHAMNRGTYNQIVELPKRRWWQWFKSSLPKASNVIPPGQSGFMDYTMAYNPHWYDQLILYETWTYKPMLFRKKDIKNVAESLITLEYSP